MTSFTQADIDKCIKDLNVDGKSPYAVGNAFIGGELRGALSGASLDSLNPATGKVVARIASCGADDVDEAVKCAREAFDSGAWSGMHPKERKNVLLRLAELIEENALELAVLDSVEAGKPIIDCLEIDVPDAVGCFQYHAEAINKVYGQVAPTGTDNLGLIVREPVGVVGLIVPWNFPLLMAVWKLAPALATGNCCVIKPSELTSLSLIRLGELAIKAGIPSGVLNIVPGYGISVGNAISHHMDVDMIGFTGSTGVGRLVLEASAKSNMKRVSLECGGKSPQLVFADAECDLDRIVPEVLSAAFWNQSENCSCGSRLLVQKGLKEKLVAALVEKVKTKDWLVGDPTKLETRCGCMISPEHCEKVLQYIEQGKAEGGKCVAGGERILESSGGNFVSLTIFDDVKNDMKIAQEEIFGPCLSVIEFNSEDEAIKIANDSRYGLAASVYTSNVHRANRVARGLHAGTVSVNCFGEGDDTTPFGGYKQSGFVGRDKSIHAHEQYQELKTIWHQIYDA